jgi:hypothetical protein
MRATAFRQALLVPIGKAGPRAGRVPLDSRSSVILDEVKELFAAGVVPDDWSLAHLDESTGEQSALYLPIPDLSISWRFPRAFDGRDDVREPWMKYKHPAVWTGAVRIILKDVVEQELPGFCFGGEAFLPRPNSATDRVVDRWQIQLFRLASLLSYAPGVRDVAEMNFDYAFTSFQLKEIG